MKLICVALTAIWFSIAAPELAYGEPVTIGLFGAAFASSFAGQLVTLGLGLAFNVGVGLIQKALAKRKAKDQTRGISFELQVGDDQPMSFTIGRYATGGRRKYTGIHGQDGRYFVDVIELGNLPCEGVPEFWVNDEKVEVDWEHPNSNGFGYPVPAFSSDGTDRLWIRWHDGNQLLADPYLLSKFGSDPDRPWTSDMIGRGCPYIVVTARFNPEIFSSVPQVLTEMPVRPVYDLRKDSTNGGSGSHRWDNPATWEPSENPIINIYNIVRGVYYGDEWVYGGQNLAAFRLPASNWIAAANECDVDIPLSGGGTEKQYRCGYEVFCDVEPLTVIEELLQACNGRMAEVGGVFKVLVGSPGAAVYSFTDDDVLVTEGQSFNPFPTFAETHNGIEATYPEPAEKWASKDAPARYYEAYIEADLDQRLAVGVEFDAAPFRAQVQRLMKAMLQEERRFRTHEFYLPPSAWRLEPNDVVSWNSDRNGYTNKKFLVVRVVGRRNFNQLVSLKEIDPNDYDWESSEELPTVVGPVKPIRPDPQPMTGWTAEGYTVLDASGRPRRPGIKVTATANLDDVKNVRVRVRLKSSGAVVFDSDATPYESPYEWVISGQWTLPDTLYQAQGKFIPFTNRRTEWSSWIDVTTPDAQLISDDILDGAIVAAKIADAAVIASKIMEEAVTSLKLADQAVTTSKLAVAAVTADVLASNAVVASKIADAAVTGSKLAAAVIDATKLASSIEPVTVVTDSLPTSRITGAITYLGKLYRWNGTEYTLAVAASEVTGQITSTQIADDAITTPKLAANAVTANEIAANAITAAKIAAGAVGADQIAANAITAAKIAADTITATQIAAGAIGASELSANSVYAGAIQALAITSDKIAAGAITAGKIAAGAIVASDIAAATITGAKIAAETIGASHIAANAITAKQLILTDFDNLVPNGNFQQGLSPYDTWNASGGFMYTEAGSYPIQGSTYLVLDRGGDGGGFNRNITLKNKVPCKPGEVFSVSAMVKGNGGNGLYVRLRWFGFDLAYKGETSIYEYGAAPTSWTNIKGKLTALSDAQFFDLIIYTHDNVGRYVVFGVQHAQVVVDRDAKRPDEVGSGNGRAVLRDATDIDGRRHAAIVCDRVRRIVERGFRRFTGQAALRQDVAGKRLGFEGEFPLPRYHAALDDIGRRCLPHPATLDRMAEHGDAVLQRVAEEDTQGLTRASICRPSGRQIVERQLSGGDRDDTGPAVQGFDAEPVGRT